MASSKLCICVRRWSLAWSEEEEREQQLQVQLKPKDSFRNACRILDGPPRSYEIVISIPLLIGRIAWMVSCSSLLFQLL